MLADWYAPSVGKGHNDNILAERPLLCLVEQYTARVAETSSDTLPNRMYSKVIYLIHSQWKAIYVQKQWDHSKPSLVLIFVFPILQDNLVTNVQTLQDKYSISGPGAVVFCRLFRRVRRNFERSLREREVSFVVWSKGWTEWRVILFGNVVETRCFTSTLPLGRRMIVL